MHPREVLEPSWVLGWAQPHSTVVCAGTAPAQRVLPPAASPAAIWVSVWALAAAAPALGVVAECEGGSLRCCPVPGGGEQDVEGMAKLMMHGSIWDGA